MSKLLQHLNIPTSKAMVGDQGTNGVSSGPGGCPLPWTAFDGKQWCSAQSSGSLGGSPGGSPGAPFPTSFARFTPELTFGSKMARILKVCVICVDRTKKRRDNLGRVLPLLTRAMAQTRSCGPWSWLAYQESALLAQAL